MIPLQLWLYQDKQYMVYWHLKYRGFLTAMYDFQHQSSVHQAHIHFNISPI